jgi:hypothetical protein
MNCNKHYLNSTSSQIAPESKCDLLLQLDGDDWRTVRNKHVKCIEIDCNYFSKLSMECFYKLTTANIGDIVKLWTYLRWCGSVSECRGVLPAHLDALLPDSRLVGNCTPPSAPPSLILPAESNIKQPAAVIMAHVCLFVKAFWRYWSAQYSRKVLFT